MSSEKSISAQTLKRLPMYLEYLKGREETRRNDGKCKVGRRSAEPRRGAGAKGSAQVSDGGKPKVGYVINELIADINEFLGVTTTPATRSSSARVSWDRLSCPTTVFVHTG